MKFSILIFSTFFFFKQKTAYEIMPSLVGSEMCIRDSLYPFPDRVWCQIFYHLALSFPLTPTATTTY